MPSYCSISEAWGYDFNLEESKSPPIKNDIIEPHIEKYTTTQSNSDKCFDEIKCKKLLNEILKCEDCQDLIYKHLHEQYNSNNFVNNLFQNNETINLLFFGFFIFLFLDFFMKIGRNNRSR